MIIGLFYTQSDDVEVSNYENSGKLKVVEAVLSQWHSEGHRVLLFTQTRQMLDIIEEFIRSKSSFSDFFYN